MQKKIVVVLVIYEFLGSTAVDKTVKINITTK